MDSTLINIECIDEIADMQGLKAEVAAITEAAMQGEIDFRESLTRRVALLAGLPEERAAPRCSITACSSTRAPKRCCRALQRAGSARCWCRAASRISPSASRSSSASTTPGQRAGGPYRRQTHRQGPRRHRRRRGQGHTPRARAHELHGFKPEQVIAAGDGANDMPMLREAGIGIAYHAKPVVRQQATYALNHCGLDGILNLLG
jgi:phosphoserine phosphatase